MARFSRIDVARIMKQTGIVPLFYHNDITICKEVVRACHAGGLRVMEFTNRGDFAQKVFAELVKFVAKEFPDMMIGIGSIVDPSAATLFIQNGADFIVSPLFNEAIAPVCNRRKILWIPGCATLTEIGRAEELGAEVCKLFPCDPATSPDFIRAIKGPCPWTDIMPTGGVEPTKENLSLWFNAGACCVGMGSKLVSKEIIISRSFDLLAKKAEDAVQLVREIRD